MQEDNFYRTSSQYRLWSFTEDSLRQVRESTNAAACDRVRAAIRRWREARKDRAEAGADGDTPMTGSDVPAKEDEQEIDCLTADEELALVRHYCEMCMSLGDQYEPPLPTIVRATAIQYIRRFYLTNSPMTYHPRSIMPCALFLATKTDNYYMSLKSFTAMIRNSTMEDIIAPEFLLTQGLRFTFDVRHPFRGLEGATMELAAIAKGEGHGTPHMAHNPSVLRERLQSLPPASPHDKPDTPAMTRITKAHRNTREILKTAAQYTEAYFLYTPAQIWLSALLIVDEPLAEFYLDTKLGNGTPPTNTDDLTSPHLQLSQIRAKLNGVLQSCATMMNDYLKSRTPDSEDARRKELKRIAKKLHHCQDPEKANLVEMKNRNRGGGV
ncbi:hypothetical protein KEM55_004490, partial [Ascosphaera atra]